ALLAVAVDGILGLQNSRAMMDEVAKVRAPSVLGLEIVNEGQTAIRSENRMVGLLLLQGATADQLRQVLQRKQKIWQRIDQGWKIYEPLPQTAEEAVLWRRFLEEWRAWKQADDAISAQIEKLSAASDDSRMGLKAGFLEAAYAAIPLFDKSEATLGQLVDMNVQLAEAAAKTAEERGQRTMGMMLGVSIVATLLLIGLGAAIARSIFATIGGEPEVAKQVVQRIAAGDLSQTLTLRAGDGESLMAHQQQMQSSLQGMVREIVRSVEQTEQSADGLASAAQQVAAASADTSDSASSMAASVEELSVSISQVSDNAHSALGIAESTGRLSLEGGNVIELAMAEINRIADTVRTTAGTLASLSENSTEISRVVQVIKEVAEQTNLLALNAAIEAARAGEAGRGFAVVADEVRKLAERTTVATVEIGNMITRIQNETQSSVTTMESAVGQVDKGVRLAGEAGGAIREIRAGVTQVVQTVTDIVSSIQEQSVASQQIAQRVERVAQASEENNAAAQQTAESAADLRSLARGLQSTIRRFRVS
ncbi:MAG: hypothetical protein RIR00_2088, partial [Pseudomonadota bacterium]